MKTDAPAGEPGDTGRERRHFWRSVFDAPVQVLQCGAHVPARLLDLSLKGALLGIGPSWQGLAGQPCQLQLDLGPAVAIRMEARIVFIAGGHAGLRCEGIDLDSITHLRRLLELNAGTEQQLQRDLASLVA